MTQSITIPGGLQTNANPSVTLLTPTIEPGDVTVTIDGVTTSASNVPTVDAQGDVTLLLSAAEEQADVVTFADQSDPPQWLTVQVYPNVVDTQAIVDAIAERSNVYVTPSAVTGRKQAPGKTITTYTGESVSIPVGVFSDRQAVDMTDENLWMGIADANGGTIHTPDAHGTLTGFDFTCPVVKCPADGWTWTLRRDDEGGKVLASGNYDVLFAAMRPVG